MLAAFLVGLYSGYKRNGVYEAVKYLKTSVRQVLTEAPNIAQTGPPVYFLQPARKEGAAVTINRLPDDGRLILMTGFFEGGNQLRLIRRDGSIVAKWPVKHSRLFPDPSFLTYPPQTDWNIDLHGAVINPDGSVVFNFEYGGAVKLSRCGETLWTLRRNTHHSVTHAMNGGYWIPGQHVFAEDPDGRLAPFTSGRSAPPFAEALALHVSEEGKVIEEFSVPQVLYDNGLEPLLTAGGYSFSRDTTWEHELLHLNKIAELPAEYAAVFPEFAPGDLLMSFRMQNMLAVIDPVTRKVKWHQTGPWRRQHDPQFNSDGTITMFNNNVYRVDDGANGQTDVTKPRISNVMRVDPRSGVTELVYGNREGQELYSTIRGKQEPLPGGHTLIAETNGGRAFEVDAEGEVVWEYINRYDATRVLELTGARSYAADYFTVPDWHCPSRSAQD